MRMSPSAWERTQYGLVDDFLNLFLLPVYDFAVEADYPRSPAAGHMVEKLGASIQFPEGKLLRLEQFWDESTQGAFERRLADWPVVLAFEVLQGFGHDAAAHLSSAEFSGLKQLANVWGLHLAGEFQRVFRRFEFFTGVLDLTADLVLVLRQVPARDLGEMIRGAATPAYVRAGEIATYQYALFNGDWASMQESQSVIQAPDAQIQREIDWFFKGYSSEAIGRRMQRLTLEIVSAFREVFSSEGLKQRYLDMWPILTRQMAWSAGYRVHQNLEHDPARVARLLEAINRFGEIAAAMEQYRHNYGWQGDRDRATRIAWQAVAPKCFRLSGQIDLIREDEQQEKLIGVAEGLGGYTNRNPAIDAVRDGFLGKLGAYLAKAAENQATDYARKQDTDGNITSTEAKHVADLRSQDEDGDEDELSIDEVMSQEKEKRHPSRDPVVEEVEAKEALRTWYNALTQQERTAVNFQVELDSKLEVARRMGVSHQRVSQLLSQAWKKWKKISD